MPEHPGPNIALEIRAFQNNEVELNASTPDYDLRPVFKLIADSLSPRSQGTLGQRMKAFLEGTDALIKAASLNLKPL